MHRALRRVRPSLCRVQCHGQGSNVRGMSHRYTPPPTYNLAPQGAPPPPAGDMPFEPPPPEVPPPPVIEATAPVTPPPGTSGYFKAAAIAFGIGTGYVMAVGVDKAVDQVQSFFKPRPTDNFSTGTSITNWSGTHHVEPKRYYEPGSVEELKQLVADAHERGTKLRPVGTALSPNGAGMSEEGMVSLANLDRIIKVDKENLTVTVEAGARVSQVLEALREHGLTLENFSSVVEQQMGGWTQVAAHGTGAKLPTVEEQIVSMKILTPSSGILELSDSIEPSIFRVGKVGLGALGIVTELTLKCIPQHKLLEQTYTTTPKQLRKDHARLLREYRHVRYMWIPYTDSVVVVVSNPYNEGDPLPKDFDKRVPEDQKLAHVRKLLLSDSRNHVPKDVVDTMAFTTLRDHLIDLAPLDPKHVARVNAAEAKYWSMGKGWRLQDSTEILGFDCGGQQLVLEVAFDIGRLDSQSPTSARDIDFLEQAMKRVKDLNLPAPCPIEQRWTAASTSPMSPAHSQDPATVFSWVGIIMYLPPSQGQEGRQAVTQRFEDYVRAMEPLYEEYNALPHWAKVEVPAEADRLERLKARLRKKYPLEPFRVVREGFDPKGILSNQALETLIFS